ncbi:hypothetical protein [Nonomuraea indica]|uniref:Htaa protein n=1 Tax=Nonomuraea indica TaxID=1581193 RepID=A0ABW8A0L0_9ACTN
MKRLVIVPLVLAVQVAMLVTGIGPAAAAGNWAVTYLDPAPERLAPGTPYTLGYWVLQHGTHPYEGDDLGRTGLRLVGGSGRVLEFHGTALPEAGHYATAVVVPEGLWRVQGVQGRFAPHEVGTLRVPGGLTVHPLEPGLAESIRSGAHRYWGAVRPPGFPAGVTGPASPPASAPGTPDGATGSASVPAASASVPGTSASAPDAATRASGVRPGASASATGAAGAGPAGGPGAPGEFGVPVYGLALAAAGGALLALLVPAALRRTGRGARDRPSAEDRPGDGGAETLSSHGRA